MRGHSLTVFAVALFAVRSALAQDMLNSTSLDQEWTGLYFGGFFGYGWGDGPIFLTGDPNFVESFISLGVYPSAIAGDPRGVVSGSQAGIDLQFGRFVLGPVVDFSFAGLQRSEAISTFVAGQNNLAITGLTAAQQKLNWLTTARLRVGYLPHDNFLIFATGGLAAGSVDVDVSNSIDSELGCIGFGTCLAGSATDTLLGWALGGGVEYGTGPWSIKVEYLHYDLGDLTFSFADQITPAAGIEASTPFSQDAIRLGVSYRFGWNRFRATEP